MGSKEVTIYDIAKHLDIAASTVSRGLKGHYTVSKKTQKKIRMAADSMGYRSNTFAVNLRKQRTGTVGVIIPRLNSYFMAEVIAGIEKITSEAGLNLIISQSLEDVEKEMKNVRTMFDNRVDGLLVSLSENSTVTSHFDILVEKGIPLIFFDRIPGDKDFPAVMIDNEEAGYLVTRHLIGQGCKRIVHITSNKLNNVYKHRYNGYLRALNEAGLEHKREMLITGNLNEDAGIQAAESVFKLKADGVFVANDNCAASCMNELKRMGVNIPKDVAIAGFNNDMISRNVDPALTTVNYPGFKMGEIVARNLVDQLEDKSNINVTTNTTIKAELKIRNSSRRIL